MIINFNQPVKNIQGNPFKDKDGNEVPLSAFLIQALIEKFDADVCLTESQKMKHWLIAKKVIENAELSLEELALAKSRVLLVNGTAIAGPICDLLEGN